MFFQRDGSGKESFPDGTVFEGKWKRGLKSGRGVKTKKRGLVEHQIWDNGCLIRTNIDMPAKELPAISRWL